MELLLPSTNPRRSRMRRGGGALALWAARSLAAGLCRWFRDSLLVPPGPSPGSLVARGGSPHMGDPPDPPFKVCAALNGRPEGGRRAPRPGTSPPRLAPANKAGAALGLGAAPLSLRALVGADRPRPPRAPCSARAGGRWHMPGRGPAARGAGAVNGLFPASGERTSQKIGAARCSTSARTGQGQASAARGTLDKHVRMPACEIKA